MIESFCISLMEAASCGLKVVSTNVGGVPEVLPEDMTELCAPSVGGIIRSLSRCIDTTMTEEEDEKVERENKSGSTGVSRAMVERESRQHERVKALRSWMDVAEQTEKVYKKITEEKGDPLSVSTAFSWAKLNSKLAQYGHLRWHELVIGAGLAVLLEVASFFAR